MISQLWLSEIAQVTGGILQGEDASFSNVSTDTRTLAAGDLFVALSGENFDGNSFAEVAANKGATGALVSRFCSVDLPQVRVPDTLKALGQLAVLNRSKFTGALVGITGSSGKTTVKEMTASILAQCGSVTYTKGNLNNHIGVPLTLLNIDKSHRYAVVEMGASAVGEIAYTSSLARPDVVIINNAGDAHLQGFGSRENIVIAKGEIISGLTDAGTAILNADDIAYEAWQKMASGKQIISFGFKGQRKADVTATNIIVKESGTSFELKTKSGATEINLGVSGEHNVANALAAACAALALQIDLATIKKGLELFLSVKGRLHRQNLGSMIVIDDTYNANPASVKAGLAVLSAESGVKLAVLGDMAELGAECDALHESVGRFAAEQKIDYLFVVGAHALSVAKGFGVTGAGIGAGVYASKRELLTALAAKIKELAINSAGTKPVVYVKGSRSARMEEITQQLLQWSMEAAC